MRILERAWLFDLGADIYAWFSANPLWRESCAHLARYIPSQNGRGPLRVLDLGCGPGVTAIALAQERPDVRIIGVDIAPRMIEIARRRTSRQPLGHNISYVIADAAALPFAESSVDAVAAHSFLYLVSNRRLVLEEAHRVLRPGAAYASMEPREGRAKRGALLGHWRDLRYVVSIALWRPYSKYHGRLDEKDFPATLEQAGFHAAGTEPALEGLGIVGHAQK